MRGGELTVDLTYKGLPYYEYEQEINMLIRLHRLDDAEKLLKELIPIADSDTSANRIRSSTWYYAALANIYRKKGDVVSEINILERFTRNNKGERTSLHERLEKLNTLMHRG